MDGTFQRSAAVALKEARRVVELVCNRDWRHIIIPETEFLGRGIGLSLLQLLDQAQIGLGLVPAGGVVPNLDPAIRSGQFDDVAAVGKPN